MNNKIIMLLFFSLVTATTSFLGADQPELTQKTEMSGQVRPPLRLKLDWTDYLSIAAYFLGPTALYSLANYSAHNDRWNDQQPRRVIMDGLFTGTLLTIDLICSNLAYNKEIDTGVVNPKKRARQPWWIIFKLLFVLRKIHDHSTIPQDPLKLPGLHWKFESDWNMFNNKINYNSAL